MCRPSLLNYHQIPTAESQQNEILSLDQMKDKLRSAERRMKERTAERQPSPPGASFPRAFSYSFVRLPKYRNLPTDLVQGPQSPTIAYLPNFM